jgi:hypothetical protein
MYKYIEIQNRTIKFFYNGTVSHWPEQITFHVFQWISDFSNEVAPPKWAASMGGIDRRHRWQLQCGAGGDDGGLPGAHKSRVLRSRQPPNNSTTDK